MVADLAGQWVALLPSSDAGKNPRRVLLGDVPLVVWRSTFGRPAVFLDRCPHRDHPLSTGRRTLTGHLVCDGHDWEFAADGRCLRTHKPRDRSLCAATAFPAKDADGVLWVLMPDPPAPAD